MATPRSPSVAIRKMDVGNVTLGMEDALDDIPFLNVHMKCVGQHLQVRSADLIDHLHCRASIIIQIGFITVNGFQGEDNLGFVLEAFHDGLDKVFFSLVLIHSGLNRTADETNDDLASSDIDSQIHLILYSFNSSCSDFRVRISKAQTFLPTGLSSATGRKR